MRCARRSLWLNVNQKVLHAHVNKSLLLKYFGQERQATQHLGATLPPLESPAEEHKCIRVQQRKPMSYHAYIGNG